MSARQCSESAAVSVRKYCLSCASAGVSEARHRGATSKASSSARRRFMGKECYSRRKAARLLTPSHSGSKPAVVDQSGLSNKDGEGHVRAALYLLLREQGFGVQELHIVQSCSGCGENNL